MSPTDISQNNKRIAKNTLMLYIRMLFSMVVSLYTSRVVLKTLGIEDYGIYNVVGGAVVLFSFLNNAMSVATQRFLNFELGKNNLEKVKSVFNVSVIIYVFIALLILILSETLGLYFFNTELNIPHERQSAAMWVFQVSILGTCLSVVSIPYKSLIIAYEKMTFFAYISIVEVVLKLIIAFALVYIAFDHLIVYSFLLFITGLFVIVAYTLYCRSNFSVARFHFLWDKELFKNLTSYSVWNMFGALAGVAKDQGISLLLNVFFSPIVNAAHAISMQVNSAVIQFYNSILVAVQPQIVKYYAANEMNNMFRLVFWAVKIIFLLLCVISIPLLAETDFILKLWLGNAPINTVTFIRVLIIIIFVDAMATPLMTVAHATGKIKYYQGVVGTITICIIPISYVFLKFGFVNPAIVYVVSLCISIINFILRLWFVKRLANFPIRKFLYEVVCRILIMICILILLLFFVWDVNDINTIYMLLLKFVVSSMLTLFVFYCICLNCAEKKVICEKFKSFSFKL